MVFMKLFTVEDFTVMYAFCVVRLDMDTQHFLIVSPPPPPPFPFLCLFSHIQTVFFKRNI